MEACGGAHYWAREHTKIGHTARLMAAQFANPYRKSGKNDVNDAEVVCEAVGTRALTVSNRAAQVNQIRRLLGEFGLVVPVGIKRLRKQLPELGRPISLADASPIDFTEQILSCHNSQRSW
jgi:transposase